MAAKKYSLRSSDPDMSKVNDHKDYKMVYFRDTRVGNYAKLPSADL